MAVYGHAQRLRRPGTNMGFVIPSAAGSGFATGVDESRLDLHAPFDCDHDTDFGDKAAGFSNAGDE